MSTFTDKESAIKWAMKNVVVKHLYVSCPKAGEYIVSSARPRSAPFLIVRKHRNICLVTDTRKPAKFYREWTPQESNLPSLRQPPGGVFTGPVWA